MSPERLFPHKPRPITRLTCVRMPEMKWYRLSGHESVRVPRLRFFPPRITVNGGTTMVISRDTAARILREMRATTACRECGHQFDDNPGRSVCMTCEDWLVS